MNPYVVLGVERDAEPKAIKAAYRKLSREHHPDSGGDRDKFEQVKLAFDVLIDPERRKRYDTTGRVDLSPITDTKVREMIRTAVLAIIAGPKSGEMDDPVWTDVKTKVIQSILNGRREIQNNMASSQRRLERITRLMERFKTKSDDDPVGDVLREQKETVEGEMIQHENAMEMSHEIEKVFKDYDYEVGPGPEGQFSPGPPLRRGTMFLGSRPSR